VRCFPERAHAVDLQARRHPGRARLARRIPAHGILSPNDLGSAEPTIIGLYGGYGYLNLSYLRIVGVRAPGSNPEAIDLSLFGEGNPPPYAPRKGDKNLWCSAKMLKTVLGALSIKQVSVASCRLERRADEWTARRPQLSRPNEVLLRYLPSTGTCSPGVREPHDHHVHGVDRRRTTE
jgi:hypothetical protein